MTRTATAMSGIHQIDEHIAVAELERLSTLYLALLGRTAHQRAGSSRSV